MNATEAMHDYIAPVITRQATPLLLRQVPISYLREVWPHVAGMLGSVVERSDGCWTLANMAQKLTAEEWQLWVIYDGEYRGVLATELFFEASGMKKARVVFCTGVGAKQWVKLLSEIESWAQDQGCERIEMIARKGWARHLEDYKMTHVLLEKDLA